MLQEALNSIKAQTVQPLEVIVVTGLGEWTDTSNMYSKLNEGIVKSRGDCFIPLCDDDKLSPTYIEKTVELMEFHQADIVATFLQEFGDSNDVHGPNRLALVTALCRKAMWEKVGGYDEQAGMAADMDFWWMCEEDGARFLHTYEPKFFYRVHQNNISKTGDWEASMKYINAKHNNENHFEYNISP